MTTPATKPARKLATPPKKPTRYGLPVPELAGRVGCHESTLRNRIALGAPEPPQTSNKRSVDAWVARFDKWSIAWQKKKRETERKPTNQHDADPDAARYQRDWQRTRAERAQLELDERRSELIQRDDVVEQAGKAVLACRGRLNLLVQKMQSRLDNVPGHVVVEELQAEIDDICNGFAKGMSRTFMALIEPDADCPFCEIQQGRALLAAEHKPPTATERPRRARARRNTTRNANTRA